VEEAAWVVVEAVEEPSVKTEEEAVMVHCCYTGKGENYGTIYI
jgi:hypothetical protein